MRFWIFICLALGGVRLFFPGDAPFIHDEAELVASAFNQNVSGEWVNHGLRGSRGLEYGPLPMLFYRVLLHTTHSPVFWVVLKTLWITLLTLWAVIGLWRLFPDFPRWCAWVPFLSLYLWFYSRDLWDNSLNVGPSALLVYSYLRFLAVEKRRWLALCGACAVWVVLVHLMAVPLLAAVAVHLIFWKAGWVRRQWVFSTLLFLACAVLCAPYFTHLLATTREASEAGFRPASFFFALYGARVFSALALEYFFGWGWFLEGPWPLSWFFALAVGLTAYAFIPSFYGVFLAARALFRRPRDLREAALGFCGLALFFHLVLITAGQLVSHPHYYNAIWYVFFVLFCFGQAGLAHKRWARRASMAYLAGLSLSFLVGVGGIHFHRGNREIHYGTTLSNQLDLAQELNCYPPGQKLRDERVHSILVSLAVLRRFAPCQGASRVAPEVSLRYQSPEATRDGRVVLVPLN